MDIKVNLFSSLQTYQHIVVDMCATHTRNKYDEGQKMKYVYVCVCMCVYVCVCIRKRVYAIRVGMAVDV